MVRTHKIGSHKTSFGVDSDGAFRVRYHNTNVVTVKDGIVTLNTGGWRTNTTKLRMNQAANQMGYGFNVWQKDYGWYVSTRDGRTFDFDDGSLSFPLVAEPAKTGN